MKTSHLERTAKSTNKPDNVNQARKARRHPQTDGQNLTGTFARLSFSS